MKRLLTYALLLFAVCAQAHATDGVDHTVGNAPSEAVPAIADSLNYEAVATPLDASPVEPATPAPPSPERYNPSGIVLPWAITNPANIYRIGLAPRMNLLLPLMNLGLEIPIGNKVSIAADYYLPWFSYDKKNSKCLELEAVNAEVRYWFRPDRITGYAGNTMTGHSLAIGAHTGHYDIERDYKGSQAKFNSVYLDYAYAFELGSSMRLELSLSVGWMGITHTEYTVYHEGGKLIRDNRYYDKQSNWFGPVKAAVSLTVPILFKVNKKEGRQ